MITNDLFQPSFTHRHPKRDAFHLNRPCRGSLGQALCVFCQYRFGDFDGFWLSPHLFTTIWQAFKEISILFLCSPSITIAILTYIEYLSLFSFVYFCSRQSLFLGSTWNIFEKNDRKANKISTISVGSMCNSQQSYFH